MHGYRNFAVSLTPANLATPDYPIDITALAKLYQPGQYPGYVDAENRTLGTITYFSANAHIWTPPVDMDGQGNSETQFSGKTLGLFMEKGEIITEIARLDLKSYSNVQKINIINQLGFSASIGIDPDTTLYVGMLITPASTDGGRLIESEFGDQRIVIHGLATEENEQQSLPGALLIS